MAKVLLHCPLNISRSLVQMMEEFCSELNEKHGVEEEIETQPHRLFSEGLWGLVSISTSTKCF